MLQKIENVILYTTIFLTVVFMLPMFPNPFITVKILILVFGVLATFLIKAIRIFVEGELKISFGIFDLTAIVFVGSYIAATLIRTPNKMEAVLFPGTATILVFSALLYWLTNQLNDHSKKIVEMVLLVAGSIISFVSLLAVSRLLNGIEALPAYAKDPTFNIAGGSLAALIFLVSIIPLAFHHTFLSKNIVKNVIFGTLLGLISIGAIATFVETLRSTDVMLPSFRSSWFVAAESLKQDPTFGSGPGNYLSAFNRFRPLTDNQTEYWAARFTTSRNFYLTVITEVGLLGVVSLIFLLTTTYRMFVNYSKEKGLVGMNILKRANFVSLVIILMLFALFPNFPIVTMLLFVLMALSTNSKDAHLRLSLNQSKAPSLLISIPLLAAILFVGFHAVRIASAEATYKASLDAVIKNDGKTAYETIQKAIQLSPYVDRYRITYSQLNLAIARNLASTKDLNEEQKKQLAALVEQSIREGKNAVALNRERAGNWQNLSSIYQAVVPLAKGADQFAVQTLNQTIILDPGNVNTRILLGGMFYSAKNYQTAIDILRLAVSVKPDFANAHYNLAQAYRENGNIDKAISEMETVLTLIKSDSKDYEAAQNELKALKDKGAKPTQTSPTTSTELTVPSPSPTPAISPKLDLGNDAVPPSEPQPTVEPTPTTTPLP